MSRWIWAETLREFITLKRDRNYADLTVLLVPTVTFDHGGASARVQGLNLPRFGRHPRSHESAVGVVSWLNGNGGRSQRSSRRRPCGSSERAAKLWGRSLGNWT